MFDILISKLIIYQSNRLYKMKKGPHRNLQLLGGAPQNEDATDTPKIKHNFTPYIPTLQFGVQTPTATTTLASGRSVEDESKTPTKKSEKGNPSPKQIFPSHQPLRSSVSQNQLVLTGANSKNYHPVLKKGQSNNDVAQFTKSKTQSINTHNRRQTLSASSTTLAERALEQKAKSNTKKTMVKDKPFNYEERQSVIQRSEEPMTGKAKVSSKIVADQPILELSKSLSYENETTKAQFQHEVQLMEVFNNDPSLQMNIEDHDEVQMRPSDEVSMNQENQLFLLAIGSGFSHSRIGSGQNWNNRKVDDQTNTSFRVFVEEHKNELKTIENDYVPTVHDEKFEVIREDLKDSFFQNETRDQRDNSDFKKFNGDDDFQNSLVDHKWPQRNGNKLAEQFKRDDLPRVPLLNLNDIKEDNLEDTPKNIKVRTQISFKDSTMNQGAVNPIYQGSNDNNILSSLNFQAPNPQAIANQSNSIGFPQNHAHILSFSEDNTLLNQVKPEAMPNFTYDNRQSGISNVGQLNEAQTANTIIEVEKNYVIMQYESILQQLSAEFQRVLTKTKETDEHLAQQELLIQTQQKIIQEKEAAQFQQEQVNSQLSGQVQDLLQELESLTIETHRRQKADSENDQKAASRDMLENSLQNFQSKIRLYESQEICTKEHIEALQGMVMANEAKLRQKEEQIFLLQRQTSSMERDMMNMKEVENSLKLEIQRASNARVSLEESAQEIRQRATADQIVIRLRENEIESLTRDFKQLKGSLESFQQGYSQIMRENEQLKTVLNEHERAGIQMKSMVLTKDQQCAQLDSDVQRLTTIIEKERTRSNNVEEDYRRKVESLQAELKEMQQQRREQEAFNKTRSFDQREQQSNIYQDTLQSSGRYDTQTNNWQSPKIRESVEQLPQNQWNYAKQIPLQQQSVVPQVQQLSRQVNDEGLSVLQARRKTVNQYSSKLSNLLQWENQPQLSQGVPSAQGYMSLEKTNINGNSSTILGVGRTQGPNAQQSSAQIQKQYPSPTTFPQSQYSPRVQQKNISFNLEQEQLQAAGKKSTSATSPFAVTQESQQKKSSYLSNTLSAMQIDKERLENEYRKLGTSKNKMQIEKKKDLEMEVEVINRNIHQIKQKLREINAL